MGTWHGFILVYQNEILINQFDGCDGNNACLSSILFDQNGYIATSCDDSKLYLFSPDGAFSGKRITTPDNPDNPDYPNCIGFDPKGRFILISRYQISIYN